MRNVLMLAVGAIAALSVATLLARRATRHGLRAATAQPSAARADDISRQFIAPVRYAMINSLWGETSIAPCMVGAVWSDRLASASFSPQMRLSMRAPLRTAAPARTANWMSRARVDLAAANDADIAARMVAMEPGVAPVVRVLKIASFRRPAAARPERTYGQALRAA